MIVSRSFLRSSLTFFSSQNARHLSSLSCPPSLSPSLCHSSSRSISSFSAPSPPSPSHSSTLSPSLFSSTSPSLLLSPPPSLLSSSFQHDELFCRWSSSNSPLGNEKENKQSWNSNKEDIQNDNIFNNNNNDIQNNDNINNENETQTKKNNDSHKHTFRFDINLLFDEQKLEKEIENWKTKLEDKRERKKWKKELRRKCRESRCEVRRPFRGLCLALAVCACVWLFGGIIFAAAKYLALGALVFFLYCVILK
mmetsp:Transcript_102/g.213  ORF Transcript_102/g.213 Transcript_102/m.213 type:complete len:252 (-) Transcript_102:58-813(-)